MMKVIRIEVVETKSIIDVEADFLLLKNHSNSLVGPEQAVDDSLNGLISQYNTDPYTQIGETVILENLNGIAAKNIILVGAGESWKFDYQTLETMCERAVSALADKFNHINTLATVHHGVGWGLDRREVLQVQLFGLRRGLESCQGSFHMDCIVINTTNAGSYIMSNVVLYDLFSLYNSPVFKDEDGFLLTIGEPSEVTSKLDTRIKKGRYVFIAMPFEKSFENVYDFGMRLPIEECNLLPLRLDREIFTGSINQEIKARIAQSDLLIADVTGENPNVLFELGYAQGCQIQTIQICQAGETPPFDIRDLNTIFYDKDLLRELNTKLASYIRTLA